MTPWPGEQDLRSLRADKRRASVGLVPPESYARYFGIDYHLPSR